MLPVSDANHAPATFVTPAIRSRRGRNGIGRQWAWWLAACWLVGCEPPPALAAPDQPDGVGSPVRDENGQLERRIGRLRAVLRITATQEPAWTGFAEAMRRNAARSAAVDDAWRRRGHAVDAVADLGLYGAIEDADAENARQLVPPFRALYGVLTPAQRRTADALVARYVDAQTRRRP